MATRAAASQLTDDERARALVRFQVLRPFLEDGVPLSQLAAHHGIALRTAQRWVAGYHQDGLAGLVRKRRVDQGQHRRVAPELRQCIEGLALQTPPPSAAFVHRQVMTIASEHGWHPPSYRTLRHKLSCLVAQADIAQPATVDFNPFDAPDCTQLILVDEADRLKMVGLEHLRDVYDRGTLG